jgi:hypothetical protein
VIEEILPCNAGHSQVIEGRSDDGGEPLFMAVVASERSPSFDSRPEFAGLKDWGETVFREFGSRCKDIESEIWNGPRLDVGATQYM